MYPYMDNDILQRLQHLEDKIEKLSKSYQHRHEWDYFENDQPQLIVKYTPNKHYLQSSDHVTRLRKCQICDLCEREIWEWCTNYSFWEKTTGKFDVTVNESD